MKNLLALIGIIFCMNSFCFAQNTYTYSKPKFIEDGWQTNDLKSHNLDSTLVHKLFTQLYSNENKIQSVLFVKDKQIIIEEYLNGQTIDQKHDLRSTTKSIRSILLGIAIDKGFIDDVNDPISKYLKSPVPTKNIDLRKDKITIKHLLTMSSGLDCNDWNKHSKGQEDKVYKKKNWLQYTLNLPMVNEPGTVSNYCSMGAILIAEIINQASGMAIDKFAEQFLFTPLNISNTSWGHTSKKDIIPSAKRLYMTSRDMAKIGQLLLNKGEWHDNQIVSEKWIIESTTPKTKITGIDYGYFWWNIPFKVNEMTYISKTATGNGGQYIFVFPELDIVAVFTGSAYNSQDDKLPFKIITDILLPTFTREK
ncbi:beta-lactamase family protein [Tamlana agarivorans]|uniref:Beta-lactamase family protein n=1 Tax=Pseudotamlana agarivorans TaxID=481183 RepID=A0ACC5U565_9FLAO|nr:serine hydrolase [Tamlana agarivorans]MBU2949430.1 beta-lactamase family protein [Tamlana agarivorans]